MHNIEDKIENFNKLLTKFKQGEIAIITDEKSQGNFIKQLFNGKKLPPLIVIIRDYNSKNNHQSRFEYAKNIIKMVKQNNAKHKILIAENDLQNSLYIRLKQHGITIDGIHLPERLMSKINSLQKKFGVKNISTSCHSEASFIKLKRWGLTPNYATLSPVFATKTHPKKRAMNRSKFAKILHNNAKSYNILALGGVNVGNINKLKIMQKYLKLKGIAGIRF